MVRALLIILVCVALSGCCVKVAEVDRTANEDGTFTEDITGFRYDCSFVLIVPGGKNIVSNKCNIPTINNKK